MLILDCPCCGLRAEETEFTPGGQAHVPRAAAGSSDAEFEAYLFLRNNPRGVHFERWRHSFGCGKWFIAARCTLTLEVFGTYAAQLTAPPPEVLDRIRSRRPEWEFRP